MIHAAPGSRAAFILELQGGEELDVAGFEEVASIVPEGRGINWGEFSKKGPAGSAPRVPSRSLDRECGRWRLRHWFRSFVEGSETQEIAPFGPIAAVDARAPGRLSGRSLERLPLQNRCHKRCHDRPGDPRLTEARHISLRQCCNAAFAPSAAHFALSRVCLLPLIREVRMKEGAGRGSAVFAATYYRAEVRDDGW
jgi:hypothetical protein